MSGPSATPASDPFGLGRAVARDTARLASDAGRPELDRQLEADMARFTSRGVSVVVAGPARSGKTDLINALLARPALLPDAEEGSIPALVMIRYAAQRTARLHRAGEPSLEVDLGRVHALGQERVDGGPPLQVVEIGLDHPLLGRGVVLVDTPGLGDPTLPDDAVTAALAWADALVYVASAGAPLSAADVAFLARAAERVDACVLVVSKTDSHPGWREIEREDREIVGRLLPAYRGIPVLHASSRLANKALAIWETDRALADEVATEGNVRTLETLLSERVASQVQVIRLANLLRSVNTVIGLLELPHRAVLAADGSEAERHAFETDQERLQAHGRAVTAGLARLGDAFEIARIELTTELSMAFSELTRRYEALLTASDQRRADTLADRLQEDLEALAVRMTDRLGSRLVEAVDAVASTLAAEVEVTVEPLPTPTMAAPVDVRARADGGVYGMFRTHYYPFLMGSGLVTTVGGVAATVVLGAGATAAAPFVTVASLAAGALTMIVGRRAARGAEARTTTRESVRSMLVDARTDLQGWLQRRLLETRRAIEADLRDQAEMRTRDLREAVERQQQVLSADRATRQRARAEATKALEELGALRARAHEVRRSLGRPAG